MSNRTALRLHVPSCLHVSGFFVLAAVFGAGCDTAPDGSMHSTDLAAERSVDDHTIEQGYGFDSLLAPPTTVATTTAPPPPPTSALKTACSRTRTQRGKDVCPG